MFKLWVSQPDGHFASIFNSTHHLCLEQPSLEGRTGLHNIILPQISTLLMAKLQFSAFCLHLKMSQAHHMAVRVLRNFVSTQICRKLPAIELIRFECKLANYPDFA